MEVVESDLRVMGVKRLKTRALESYGKEKSAPIVGEVQAKIERTKLLLKQKQKLQFIVFIISLFICSYIKI
jgi:hypothetical protein